MARTATANEPAKPLPSPATPSYDISERSPILRRLLAAIKDPHEAPREVHWVCDVYYSFALDLVARLRDGPLLCMMLRYLYRAKVKALAQALADMVSADQEK